ncbi:MAG: glycosyltransferase family 4 protein [Janthinobacterium lividum]
MKGAPQRTSNKPRILIVSNQFPPDIGGVSAVTLALASNLWENVAVAVQQVRDSAELAGQQAHDAQFPFPVHRLPPFETELPRSLPGRLRGPLQFAFNVLWTRRRVAAALRKLLNTEAIDVVCIQTLMTYWVADIVRSYAPHVKVIFYLHGEEIAGGPTRRHIDQLQHSALRKADASAAVSSYTRGLAERIGVLPEKIAVINNGVDTEQFTRGPKDEELQQRFGLSGKRVLLCLARLDERKGQDKLIEAMPAILAAVPNTVLLLVGSGSDEVRLRGLAAASEARSSIVFTGPASDRERLLHYRTADVYVMPNRQLEGGDTEGFGLVFLEAGACGKPVVGGRAGGVPDAILDGKTGYLVDGRSPAEIATACVRLLSDPLLAEQLGNNGLEHSRRNTWEQQSQRFLALCAQVVGQDGRTAPGQVPTT